VHDLEDLVSFGKNPDLERNVYVYPGEDSKFGLGLAENVDPVSGRRSPGCHIVSVNDNGGARAEHRLEPGDRILNVNGKDARTWGLEEILDELKTIPPGRPLRLNVLHSGADTPSLPGETTDDEAVSDHSVCPYYVTRELHGLSELTFAPYNYVLDPSIRRAMGINLEGTVVVLDEAHNVESVLCESGSAKFGEIDLCQLICLLVPYSRRSTRTEEMELIGSEKKVEVAVVAHELLLFVEKLLFYLHGKRTAFERSPEPEKLELEYRRYRNTPDDQEIQLSYDGPTGFGRNGVPTGCKPFFEELGITDDECSGLLVACESLEAHLFGGTEGLLSQPDSNSMTSLIDLLSKLVTGKFKNTHIVFT
jgi:hypothetical protein